MSLAKDQSVETKLHPPQPTFAARTESETKAGLEPSLALPSRERDGGALPPSNGQPSVARAADLIAASSNMPDSAARVQMSIAMQRTVGNTRMGELLRTIPEPQAPPPATPQIAPTPTQPATAATATVQTPVVAQEPAKVALPPETKVAASTSPLASPAIEGKPPAGKPSAEAASPPMPALAVASPKAQKAPTQSTAPGTKGKAAPPLAITEEPPAADSAEAVETAASASSTKAGVPKPARGGTGKVVTGKAGAEAAASEAAGAAGKGGEGGREVKLKMPEPPADITPAARQRITKVRSAAGQAAVSHAALPPAQAAVEQARSAVTEPAEETHAQAEANLVLALGERPKPSPQIEKLCERIYEVIRAKRPPDEDSLVKAKPEEMGQAAGDLTKGSVEGDVKNVDKSYDALDKPPTGTQPQQGEPLTPPPGAPAPAINATQATPDPVPGQNVSLDADVEDNKARMAEAGMESAPAKLAQTGPVAEAREAHGELDQTAKEDPAKVLAAQQASLAKANSDMAGLQQKALSALSNSRRVTVTGTTGQQKKMVGSEEQMRTTASTQARTIFTTAQTQVNGLLQPLPQTAMQKWDKGVAVASQQFKQRLEVVAKWIEERHSGLGGTLLSVGDYFTGLPGWVTEAYDQAEQKFGDDVCNLARDISTEVNGVIMACEAIIADARTQIAGIFSRLPESLQAWAAAEQTKLGEQLDTLASHAHQVRDNFDKELVDRASQSVQEVRGQIHGLRQKAKGLLGRIADAIDRFLDDPAKFIIEALLDLLSIPVAAFWAVVAKIQKVIGDIADDPEKFANNLMAAVGQGFTQFFDNIGDHLLHGFVDWLTGGLAGAGVTLPKDFSLKSIVTFILQLMGITWPRIRKLLAKHIGEENVALIEKAYSIVANLIALGPEGIFEMLKEKLNPQEILDQIIKAAVDYMMSAVIKAVSVRILLLFNPVGAILQALEAIYKVLKWIFTNAARIFRLIETIVNGIADIIAGNIGGMANAVEKALAGLIPPVIGFLADYLGFGDLPEKVKETIISFQDWVEGILDQIIGWLVEKGKALLAAVGLGGKEDKKKAGGDEEVGKTVNFMAAGKSHKLWIAVGAAGAEVRVASENPETVEQKLSRWESTLDKAGERKGEAQTAIGAARQILTATEKDAQAAVTAKQEAKSQPENAEAGNKFKQADDKTEGEEVTLGSHLKTLFEIFGEAGSILVLLGRQLVKRGKAEGDAETADVETEEAKKVPSFGYALHTREKRIHIQRNKKGSEYPEVHIDEAGQLQEGPSTAASADDEAKIKVYNKLLELAGLKALDRKEFPTADQYREEARKLIIETLAPSMDKLVTYMQASKDAIPSAYNRLRGDIYDVCVSRNPATQYNRPGPQFLQSTYQNLTKETRQPDGIRGNQLFDAKGHTDSGPSGEEKQQAGDYIKIIGGGYLDSKKGGPYQRMNYVIMDPDAREKWKKEITADALRVLP